LVETEELVAFVQQRLSERVVLGRPTFVSWAAVEEEDPGEGFGVFGLVGEGFVFAGAAGEDFDRVGGRGGGGIVFGDGEEVFGDF